MRYWSGSKWLAGLAGFTSCVRDVIEDIVDERAGQRKKPKWQKWVMRMRNARGRKRRCDRLLLPHALRITNYFSRAYAAGSGSNATAMRNPMLLGSQRM